MSRGQSAIEFMMVVGFAMVLVIPGIYLFYTQTNDSTYEISASRVEQIGNRLIQQVEFVYPHPKNTKTTLDVVLPAYVVDLDISKNPAATTGTEIVVTMNLGGVNQTLVFFSRYPVFIGTCSGPAPVSNLFYVSRR